MRWFIAFLFFLAFGSQCSAQVGYYSPVGVRSEFSSKVDFAVIPFRDLTRLEKDLALAERDRLRLAVTVGPSVTERADPRLLNDTYRTPSGELRKKYFPPLAAHKVMRVIDDARLEEVLQPFFEAVARHPEVVDTIFLVDEPYSVGVSRSEVERLARAVRKAASKYALTPKLAVNFAGATFNAAFARHVEEAAGAFVERIDRYRSENESKPNFAAWNNTVKTARLTTYDLAGNTYVDGGIPEGIDLVSFDFYLPTLLMDASFNDTLDWFAQHTASASCQTFAGLKTRQIRNDLSFFGGPTSNRDTLTLDQLFDCRNDAIVELLHKEIAASKSPNARILLISSSGKDGLMEYDANGRAKPAQLDAKVEGRALDEVIRAIDYFRSHRREIEGLLFFTFADAFDHSLNLKISGAEGMPAVVQAIAAATKRSDLARR